MIRLVWCMIAGAGLALTPSIQANGVKTAVLVPGKWTPVTITPAPGSTLTPNPTPAPPAPPRLTPTGVYLAPVVTLTAAPLASRPPSTLSYAPVSIMTDPDLSDLKRQPYSPQAGPPPGPSVPDRAATSGLLCLGLLAAGGFHWKLAAKGRRLAI